MAITDQSRTARMFARCMRRYCLTIDTCRYDEWIDCFTDDGTFESPRSASTADATASAVHGDV